MKLVIESSGDRYVPLFYVPVYYKASKNKRVCALIPVAPFVITYHIVNNLWHSFFGDIDKFITLLIDHRQARQRKGKANERVQM